MIVMDSISRIGRMIFGSRNERLVKTYHRRVGQINALEDDVRKLTDAELTEKTAEFRRRLTEGVRPEEVLAEAFAVGREAIDRNIGIRNIFNPERRELFDTTKLPAETKALYDQTAQAIEQLDPAEVPGCEEPVPAWQHVDIPVALYEAVRELYPVSKPPFRARPFDVQLIGGMVLYEGRIAEMKTGEGKTFVAPLACYMAALEGRQCHVVTVNSYLVQRDRDWVFPAFYKLGTSVGAIHAMHRQPESIKKQMYRCDIVYGTNSEFGFDYLRDNMKLSTEDQVQKRRDFCIVDEVDNILIDEARTPLIISGPAHEDAPQYVQANNVAEQLAAKQRGANAQTVKQIREEGFAEKQAQAWRTGEAAIERIIAKFRDLGPDFLDEKEADQIDHVQYYVTKRDQKQASMTAAGVDEAQKIVGTRFYVVGNDMGWDHLINNALRAHAVYEKDRDYVVQDGEVVIVDEFTGRLMIGRQWSDGLHQAVEAKESRHGVKIKEETQTWATVTIQNFFKLYGRLAGMTGTAVTEASEFGDIYKLEVVAIPTNLPIVRGDHNDLIFLTEPAKWNAILDEIRDHAEEGRPVLVGTTSVDKSEMLSQRLTKKFGIEHEVLNAKNHEREAAIVIKAGQQHEDGRGRTMGNVTIATNMAGRGTDIMLSAGVVELGGLHVVGTERHEARRIDNQLRGRSGRQGDPGSSRFFISMEDDLMKMFAGKTTMKALSALGMQADDAIEHRWITKSVERAQRKVEERNFQYRKNLLDYDEVMDYQRSTFYSTRQAVLEERDIQTLIFDYIVESIEDATATYLDPAFVSTRLSEAVRSILGAGIDASKLRGATLDQVESTIRSDAKAEVRQEIENSLGEYMGDDIDPKEWDVRGLSSWAMSRFNVDLKQSQLRDSTLDEVAERLEEAAFELIDRRPLDGLAMYFEPDYAARELADWAKQKFGIELDVAELSPRSGERWPDAQQRVGDQVYEQARQAYRRREIVYPVEHVLETVFGVARQGADAGAWAADQLAKWANHRYQLDWTAESVGRLNGQELRDQLIQAAEPWQNGQLQEWVDSVVRDDGQAAVIAERFQQRWAVALDEHEIADADDVSALLAERAQRILRSELTRLEQFVLLQILDQAWKDHLYAMDQLKDSIGLQAYAERDPKVMYKSEGARMFQQMLRSVGNQVTDLIFKARLSPEVQMRNPYADGEASHDVRESTGVGADSAPLSTAQQQQDLETASRAGAEERQVVQPIVNKDQKVGRNDPCPCGSGKKYKKCCGAR